MRLMLLCYLTFCGNDWLTARVAGQGTSRVLVHRMRRVLLAGQKSATGAANKYWECTKGVP
jgi:hypothetical protein